jgi:protein kinase-like protein/NHL repeat-containing protein
VAPQVGDVVAGYRLDEQIGAGGSACPVFRATHLRLHREVALKLLPRDRASEDFVRRFEREARLAASLQDHPHIVAIYDFGDTDEVLYLAMRFVRGPNLEQLIAARPLSLSRSCVLLGQVADALDAAHAAGLVHRDVKPSNIFVEPATGQNSADRAYVGDFGLTLRRDVSSATRALWFGSPRYLAPERWAGSLPEPSVDVYALGCVAYACLSGFPPFTGDSEERLRFEHAQAPPPVLSAGLAEVPPAVDAVLSKAIAKRPDDRYRSCGEFVAALRAAAVTPGAETLSGPLVPGAAPRTPRRNPRPAVLSSGPSAASGSPAAGAVPPGPRRRRAAIAVASCGLVIVLVAALLWVLSGAEVVRGNAAALSGPPAGASTARLGPDLNALAVDRHGNVYLAFRDTHTVTKLTPDGALSTVAGDNGDGFSGDGGPATEARLSFPHGLAVESDDDLLIADTGNGRIRRVDARTGIITTVAGTGDSAAVGDNGPAVAAELDAPADVAVGPDDDIYVVEADGNRVRRVDANGRITTVAGTGTVGFAGDDGPATLAEFNNPVAIAVHGEDVYVSDADNDRIRRIDSRGVIDTVAGNGEGSDEGGRDGDAATAVELQGADNLATGPDGTLYLAERFGDRVRRVRPDGRITTVAGTGLPGFSGDGGPGANAEVAGPNAVAVGPDGVVYVGDTLNRRVRRIGADGVISSVVGSGPVYPGDGLKATEASLLDPRMARVGPDGLTYIADAGDNRIRRVERDGTMSTVAGTGSAGDGGDGGKATDAELDHPTGIDFGPDGTLYIADSGNERIRARTPDGRIRTVAGVARSGSGGDGGPAEKAELTDPQYVEVTADGAIYIAEREGNRIRRIGPDGVVSTVAGTGTAGFSGDGGPATQAQLDGPTGVHVGPDGTLFISDYRNSRLRRVNGDGTIATVAGTGTDERAGDGGPAVDASLVGPFTVVSGADGGLYIADDNAHGIRHIDSTGIITMVVGNGERGHPDDDVPASDAYLATPAGISTTADGTLLITDVGNDQVYSVGPDKVLHIVAGED